MLEGNTNRDKIEIALRNAIQETFGSDEHIDLILQANDNDDLTITVQGLTLDYDGDVAQKETTFNFDANVLIGFSGTIKARNYDHAEELFAEIVDDLQISDHGWNDGLDITVQYVARHDLYNLERE
jgi:hypothetical protein